MTKNDDFTSQLIRSLNKDYKTKVAYNLSEDESPTQVKRWVSSGSKMLDYICANKPDGGFPEGRIVEIFGPPSIGKSHIATQIARSTQQMGGIVVYIDTENATSIENLGNLGVDVAQRFVYVDTHCTEEVLDLAEKTILKARAMEKDVPITIIWDSVAASSPKAELLGDYDKETIGLQARAISKGMRKITGVIGQTNTLFVILNQIRTKIGVMYGDPDTTPGGKAIPFHSSIRIKLGAGQQIKSGDDVIGIQVWAKTVKNKVAPPFRKVNFQIHFGKGIVEHEEMFDLLRKHGIVNHKDRSYQVSGTGGWKSIELFDENGIIIDSKKFRKIEFNEIIEDDFWGPIVDIILKDAMVKKMGTSDGVDIDTDSYEEMKSLADQLDM
jgi:recombination protein RecA|tara:strand:+ start:36297 stop:37445 length:1149 start_codon:yes stop_codon:yes gene_type:complete